MKRLIIITVASLSYSFISAANTLGEVPIVPDSYAQKISPDGRYVSGETSDGSCFVVDNETGKEYFYRNGHEGMGNSMALNGWVVGNIEESYPPVVMREGRAVAVQSLRKYTESYLYGITRDATRLCGIAINPSRLPGEDILDPGFNKQMYVPFYCDITIDGEIGDPHFLPCPEKDFFGATPQYCSAVWISDDGKTILGQVIESSGWYIYPIVYRQQEDGHWEYSLPSEKLFNVNGLEMPRYPHLNYDGPVPDVFDYIGDPEKRKDFEEQLVIWDESMWSEEADPYRNLDLYMTEEEIAAYNKAVIDYQNALLEFNEAENEYYQARAEIVKGSVFFRQGSMAMNSDGTMFASPRTVSYMVPGNIMPVVFSQAYIFNLEDDSYTVVGSEFGNINTNQLLPDGTLVVSNPVASGASPDASPVHSSIWLPGASDYIELDEYLAISNPWASEWMKEYLRHEVPIGLDERGDLIYVDLTISGIASVSDDKSVIAAGVDSWSWNTMDGMEFTYILSNLNNGAGVEELQAQPVENGSYRVYNFSGSLILDTKDINNLKTLAPGLYIINGKKTVIH